MSHPDSPPSARTRSRRSTLGSAAPPARHTFSLPPELLTQIVSEIYPCQDAGDDTLSCEYIKWRNDQLASLALVSKDFQEAVYSELYGNLSLVWLAGTVARLRASFGSNSRLLPLVQRLQAIGQDFEELVEERENERENEREGGRWTESEFDEADDRSETTDDRQGYRDDELKKWNAAGHDAWSERVEDDSGIAELFDILEKAPNLHFLAVRWLSSETPTHLLYRGPFRLTALDTANICPFVLEEEYNIDLTTFLANRSPNLRLLVARLPEVDFNPGSEAGPVNTLLPPLTNLVIDSYDLQNSHAILGDILKTLQPSLRSLSLTIFGADWAAPLVPFLSSLQSLKIHKIHTYGQSYSTTQIELDTIAPILSTSTSLRHLDLDVQEGGPSTTLHFPESILATLPSSLETLRLSGYSHRAVGLKDYFERMLVALKRSTPRPLRVTMLVNKKERTDTAGFVEGYEKEGIELVV